MLRPILHSVQSVVQNPFLVLRGPDHDERKAACARAGEPHGERMMKVAPTGKPESHLDRTIDAARAVPDQSFRHHGDGSHAPYLGRHLLPLERSKGCTEQLAVRQHGKDIVADLCKPFDHVPLPGHI